MKEVLARGDAAALPMMALLGEPRYYELVGFESAEPLGVWYRPAGRRNPHLMVRRLDAFSDGLHGEYRYAWELS